MTTGGAIDRRVEDSLGSVRQRPRSLTREGRLLLGILALTVIVHGWRALLPSFVGGDLLYHWGLVHTIGLGAFPPQGPYAGLPAYYPPGFHLLLAALAGIPGVDLSSATTLLGIVWLPVVPLGAYLLARRVAGRGDVALVAAALTAFGGGFDLSNDRLWVNSMFMAGHVAYPIYPRDLVFGSLPFAILAYLRATDGGRRWLGWAAVAGVILGLCGTIQVQLLLPIPFALAGLAAVRIWRDRDRWRAILGSLVVTAVAGSLVVGPWLVYLVGLIRRNGGVSIESSEDLVPVHLGFWDYPVQFGLVLPLTVVGAGVAIWFLRGAVGAPALAAIRTWAPRPAEGGILLLVWWLVPFSLAVLYQPGWPLEDALRPQRMWLLSSQAGLILAALGLVALADALAQVIARRPGPRIAGVFPIVAAVLLISIPTTLATTRLLASTWTDARYADLRLGPDRVPAMATLLGVHAPRPTILTYEDWSSLVWYETGAAVVAVEPPGFAKLAFDPATFTGHGQAERRADLAAALRGDLGTLVSTADRYAADRIVLARRGATIGSIGEPAVSAAAAGVVTGPSRIIQGNGWDAEGLDAGSVLTIPIAATGRVDLEIRILTSYGTGGVPNDRPRRFSLSAGTMVQALTVVPVAGEDFAVVAATVDLAAGMPLRLSAIDPLAVQSITGFVADPGPPAGWTLAAGTADAVVWQRLR